MREIATPHWAIPKQQLMTFSNQLVGPLRRLPLVWWQRAILLLLVVCMALMGAKLFWLLMPLPQPEQVQSSAPHSLFSKSSESSIAIDIQALTTANLFAASETEMAVPETEIEPEELEAEETKLALVLQGVVGSSDQRSARAVIAHLNKQQMYAPGDKLPGGSSVKLKQVLRDRVILDNGGRYESLSLYEQNDELVSQNSQQSGKRRIAYKSADVARQSVAIEPQATESTVSLDQLQSASSLTDVVKISVARQGREVIGFRVRPGAQRALFTQAGLKSHDIITAVNGVSLKGVKNAMSVYEELRGARSASFEILRGSEVITLNVALEDNNV